VLLANWDPASTERYLARERLVRLTEFTIVDRIVIRGLIKEALRNGYAISDQEMDVDGCGVAAPIYNGEGEVVAALNIAVVAHRFAARRDELLEAVLEHARKISVLNGYRKGIQASGRAGRE
jgi:DNA-binding IclR family transcriptional regulator